MLVSRILEFDQCLISMITIYCLFLAPTTGLTNTPKSSSTGETTTQSPCPLVGHSGIAAQTNGKTGGDPDHSNTSSGVAAGDSDVTVEFDFKGNLKLRMISHQTLLNH